MSIDIGNGKQDSIMICEDDNPIEIASKFSKKYNLTDKQEQKLALIRNKTMVETDLVAGSVWKTEAKTLISFVPIWLAMYGR